MGNTAVPILVFKPSQLANPSALAEALEGGLLEPDLCSRQVGALEAALLAAGQADSDLAQMAGYFVSSDTSGRKGLLSLLAGMVRESQHQQTVENALAFLRMHTGVERFAEPQKVTALVERKLKTRQLTPAIVSDDPPTTPPDQKWEIVDFGFSVSEMTKLVNPLVKAVLNGLAYEITIRLLKHNGTHNKIEVRVNGVMVGEIQLVYRDGSAIRLERLKNLRGYRSEAGRLPKEAIIEGLKTWEAAYNQRPARRQLRDLRERERRNFLPDDN